MRAAASKAPARARSWQSQRVTRRSLGALGLAGSVFHPVPSQSGQTSAAVLINFKPYLNCRNSYALTLHPDAGFPQVRNPTCLCTTCAGVSEPVEGGGKPAPGLHYGVPTFRHCLSSYLLSAKTRPPAPIRDEGGAKQASGADFHC